MGLIKKVVIGKALADLVKKEKQKKEKKKWKRRKGKKKAGKSGRKA